MIIQVTGVILVLACILAGFYYLGRPESADDLFQRIDASAGPSEVEKEIREFLDRFPEDSRYAKIDQRRQKIDIDKLERKLLIQSRNASSSDSRLLPIERRCMEALELAQHDPVAAEKMFAAIILLHGGETAGPLEGKQAERHAACLQLAARRRRELESIVASQAARERTILLTQLQLAEELAAEQPQRAREIYQAVINLYQDQTWANEIVETAQDRLQSLNP
jgi:serine/threonine-protein kinase